MISTSKEGLSLSSKFIQNHISKHTMEMPRRQPVLTKLLLSIMGEGRGVPDIGVETGVLISSIIFMIFSGTLVASPHVSCHLGSLELINSADYKFKRNKTKDKLYTVGRADENHIR